MVLRRQDAIVTFQYNTDLELTACFLDFSCLSVMHRLPMKSQNPQ